MRRKDWPFLASTIQVISLMPALLFLAYLAACASDVDTTSQTTTKNETTQEAPKQPASPAPSPMTTSASISGNDPSTGEQIWTNNCFTCHGTGLAGAPKIGDKPIWAPRIAQGMEVLVNHALNGLQGKSGTEMPPKGGNPQLSDADVAAAVAYMVAQSR